MNRILCSIIVVLFCTCSIQAQTKGLIITSKETIDTSAIDFNRRVALVIGNADYTQDPLKNPINDATAVAGLLRKYGFEVILDTNADRSSTLKRINQFGDSITRKKGVSIFYYSGHGMQYQSENYMLPLRSIIEREGDIENEAVKLNKVLEKMNKTGLGLNIVILDACRNNLFQEKMPSLASGLTDKQKLPGNTYLYFAAGPGETASDGAGVNSPFTESLLHAITDSTEFFQVVKKVNKEVRLKTKPPQLPAITGSPEDDFIFTANKPGKTSASIFYRPEQWRMAGPSVTLATTSDLNTEQETANGKPGSTLYVLSIGISKYKNVRPLRYADKDALDMSNALRFQAGSLYDSVESYVLVNEEATRGNIYSVINKISKKAKAGDMIMMFFAGHNIHDDFSGTSYFITYDATGNDWELPFMGSVEFERVRKFLANAPCKSILFMDGNYSPDDVRNLSDLENGVAVMTSTSPNELTLEGPQWNNGLFARSLIDGLAGFADADSSGYINLSELYRYVNEKIVKESLHRQNPVYFVNPVLSHFKIAKALPAEVLKEMRMQNIPMERAVR